MKIGIAGLALACLMTITCTSHAAPDPGTFYLRGFLGYASQALGDVNDEIENTGSFLSLVSTRTDWEKIGGAVPFGAEFGYQFSPMVSLGVGLGYQRSSRDHSADIDFIDPSSGTATAGLVTEEPKLSIFDFFGTVTLWAPSAPGLHFSGQLGVARGKYQITQNVDVASSDGTFEVSTFEGSAEKTTVLAGIFAGYEWPISPMAGVAGRVGYRFCKLSTPEGDFTYLGQTEAGPFSDSGSGPLTDMNGNTMDVDFSGVLIELGFTVRLGAPR